MTHCTSDTVAPRSAWSTGRATFTTTPSINVMLDPSIVAASTHGPTSRVASAVRTDGADSITPSSQGGLAIVDMVLLLEYCLLLTAQFARRLQLRATYTKPTYAGCFDPIWSLVSIPR